MSSHAGYTQMEKELLSEAQMDCSVSSHQEILREIQKGGVSLRVVSDADKRRPAAVTFTARDALLAEVTSPPALKNGAFRPQGALSDRSGDFGRVLS
eukprot:m.1103992 g.1103992  ORF g.1103992 m.1103992 type:complete len:97 (-) comp24335_c0_seq16:1747-2037(-)